MNKLISVIMSVYNEREIYLHDSIKSILNQTYKNIEFIIILDQPTNYKLLRILNYYKEKDNRIKLYINKKNEGLIYSLNRALKFAKGNYIARMDADDISYPYRLEKQLNYLEKYNFDLIGSDKYDINEKGEKIIAVHMASTKYIKFMFYFSVMNVCHPTFFAKKKLYDQLKGYRNILYAEDMDLIARAMCQDFKIGNISEILLYYRIRSESVTMKHTLLANSIGKLVAKAFRKCLFTKKYYLKNNIVQNIYFAQTEKQNYANAIRLHKIALQYKKKKEYGHYFKYMYLSASKSVYIKDYMRMRVARLILSILEKIKGML